VADHLGLRSIATGHTADDVAETVLMNLARGTGLGGLAGIPPVRGRVERPIIECTRREVLAYLAGLGQPYLTDPTNLTGKYARNRIRLEVLPVLEELYPGAARNLARAASLAREDLEAIEGFAGGILETRGEERVLPLGPLLQWPPALRRQAVRLAYSAALPGAWPLRSALVEAVLRLAEGGEGTRTLDLPGGVIVAARGGEGLAFYARPESPEQEEVGIHAGETLVFGAWRIAASDVLHYDPKDAGRSDVAYLDAARGPYGVRTVREGDIIRPLGLGGTKKVLRAMMDRKVPGDLRRRMPVVVGGDGEVAWIPLGEIGEGYKVEGKTEKILRVEVARIS
ncbi:MAG: tRNA lysidine(34) synthetase TilS, partial [Actinomycetota bacterium]|nr:tRNA lysidine(34) synthetase TilS [Actinomycetota bacterium]